MVARHRAVPGRQRAAGVPRRRALLRRLRLRPGLRAAGARRPRWTVARTWSCCATPTAGSCRWVSAETVARGDRAHRIPRSASTARTTRRARWPTRVAAVQAGATHVQCTANGYGERAGNADLFAVDREPGDQARHAGATARIARRADPRLPCPCRDREHRPERPPGVRRAVGLRPQGGVARERDQGGSGAVQPHRSGRPSATTCGCWSPRWPVGPASSSRDVSSASTWPAGRRRCPARSQGEGAGGGAAGRSRRPTRHWNCCCATRSTRSDQVEQAPFTLESYRVLIDHARGRRRRGRGDGQGAGGRAAGDRDGRGERAGARAGRRSAGGVAAASVVDGQCRAGRLQGPHPDQLARHRRRDPGAGGVDRRRRGSGRRWGCTATSSRPVGWPCATRSCTRRCGSEPLWGDVLGGPGWAAVRPALLVVRFSVRLGFVAGSARRSWVLASVVWWCRCRWGEC